MADRLPKPAHGSLDWLLLRHSDNTGRCRFGASEAPTLMGVNPWENLTDLYITKTNPPQVSDPNPAMERGNVLEPALIAHAATLLGQPVNTPDEMFTEGRLIATLDGITDDGRIIVEAKTTTAYSSDDPVPPAYYWQVQAQLACVPTATYGLVVVLDKRMRLGSWVVVRNDADIAGLLLRADEIGDCIDARQLPVEAEPTEEQVKMLFPAPAGVVELPASAVALIDAWQAAKAARTDAEALEQQYRDRVAALLGEAESGTLDGRTLVTFKARKGSSRLDVRGLERDHPALVDQYRVQGAPTRVLRSYSDG